MVIKNRFAGTLSGTTDHDAAYNSCSTTFPDGQKLLFLFDVGRLKRMIHVQRFPSESGYRFRGASASGRGEEGGGWALPGLIG